MALEECVKSQPLQSLSNNQKLINFLKGRPSKYKQVVESLSIPPKTIPGKIKSIGQRKSKIYYVRGDEVLVNQTLLGPLASEANTLYKLTKKYKLRIELVKEILISASEHPYKRSELMNFVLQCHKTSKIEVHYTLERLISIGKLCAIPIKKPAQSRPEEYIVYMLGQEEGVTDILAKEFTKLKYLEKSYLPYLPKTIREEVYKKYKTIKSQRKII